MPAQPGISYNMFFENAFDFVDTLGVSDIAPTAISSAQNQETATDTEGDASPTGKIALQSCYNGCFN